MPKLIFIFLLLAFNSNVIYSQNCDDGILNGDEIRVDCGGFYCPKCPNNDMPGLQNIMTSSKLGFTYNNTAATLIAVDSAGKRAIVSSQNATIHNSVYSVALDGSFFEEIFDVLVQAPGSDHKPAWVDISRDGSKVLWSTGKGGIYVSDFNGDNVVLVADRLKNQEEDSGEIELVSFTSPKFNADGSSIIFSHSRNGSKNRGLWQVGINQTLATNQLLNVEDFTEAFTETIWNLGGQNDFYQLQVTENNEIQFLSNLLNEDVLDSDLMFYEDGAVEILAKKAVRGNGSGQDHHTISKDGKFSFWINPWDSNTSYSKLKHETGTTLKIDLVPELHGVHDAKRITSNYDGSLLLISGTQSGGGAVQNMLVKLDGEKYYPIHFAHGFLNSFGSIRFIVLSEKNESLVYVVGRTFPEPYEVWTTDVTPPSNNIDAKYPILNSFLITNNEIIPNHINNSIFKLNVDDGEGELVNKIIFSTFADDTLNLGYYLDPHQGSQLYNDGLSFGDMAVDNQFTHNDIFYSGQGVASNRDLPYAFSVRFSLLTDNHITSYDVYPFFIVDQVNGLNEREDKNVNLYPTLLTAQDRSMTLEVDFPYKTASWQIFDINGRLFKTSSILSNSDKIDARDLSEGIFFLQMNIDNQLITKKFIIQE